jgi:hypothetical protein
MKREDFGGVADRDRLAWLDGHRAYIEVGKTGAPGSGHIVFDGDAWHVSVKLADAQAYHRIDSCSTLPEAVDALGDALAGPR